MSQILHRENQLLSLSGLTNTAKAFYLVLLWQAIERPLLIVVDGNRQAESLFELVHTFFDLLTDRPDLPDPQVIPALDVLPHQRLSPHTEITEQRAIGLWRLATQKVPITITPWVRLCCAPKLPTSTGNSRYRFAWARNCRSRC